VVSAAEVSAAVVSAAFVSAAVVSFVLPPHAVMDAAITAAIVSASAFFIIINSSSFCYEIKKDNVNKYDVPLDQWLAQPCLKF
jgi:hypothetical protein